MKYLSLIVAFFALASCGKNSTKPEIKIEGANPYNISLNETYNDPGATATDKEDGAISDRIQIESGVNTALAGTYYIKYIASDKRKLKSDEAIRTVNVKITSGNLLGYYTSVNIVNGISTYSYDAVNIESGDLQSIYLNNFAGLDSVKVKLVIGGENGTSISVPEQTVVHHGVSYLIKGDGTDGAISTDGKKMEIGYFKKTSTSAETGKMNYNRL